MSEKAKQGWRMIACGGFFCVMGALASLILPGQHPFFAFALVLGVFGGYAAGFSMSLLVKDAEDIALDKQIREHSYWPDEEEA